ncbi:MAG: TRAP transporter substrate-binding protein, partial [Bradyrhizobium sp.]
AIIGEPLKSYDDGVIDQEDVAALGGDLDIYNLAIAERRATLQSGPADPTWTTGPTLASRR